MEKCTPDFLIRELNQAGLGIIRTRVVGGTAANGTRRVLDRVVCAEALLFLGHQKRAPRKEGKQHCDYAQGM
jgi:hypothetical protein